MLDKALKTPSKALAYNIKKEALIKKTDLLFQSH